LQSAEQGAGQSGNQAEEALDRTRQLADNVDSLRRRLDENSARGNNSSRGQQPGQQSGQRDEQGNPQSGSNSADGRQGGGTDRSGGSGDGYDRQLNSELRQRLSDAQGLRRQFAGSSGPVGLLDQAIEELRRVAEVGPGHEIETSSDLRARVIEPLRQLELQLSRQAQSPGQTNLRLRDEGAAPQQYRKAVEEYYRRLSGGGRKQ